MNKLAFDKKDAFVSKVPTQVVPENHAALEAVMGLAAAGVEHAQALEAAKARRAGRSD